MTQVGHKLNLQVGALEGEFDGDIVGLSVIGESVGFLVGEAMILWNRNDKMNCENISWTRVKFCFS